MIKMLHQKKLPSQSFDQAKEEIQKRLQRDKFDQWVTKEQSATGVVLDEKVLNGVAPASASREESSR